MFLKMKMKMNLKYKIQGASLSPKHEAVYGTFSFVFMISFKTEKRSSFENSGVFNTSIVLP